MSFDTRITQEGDVRITSESDIRILESGSSSISLVGVGNITPSISIIKAAKSNLNGEGSLTVSGQTLPFQSTLYIKVAGVWKTTAPFVKFNNIWVTPIYIAKKISGNWRRIY